MGAGKGRAGLSRAGYDPTPLLTPMVNAPPVALRYEGSAKDWVLDTSGNYRSVTPTEQAMILSICVNQNQIKSSPQTGNTLDQIVYLGSPNLVEDVKNRIRNSNPAKALVAARKAETTDIAVQVTNRKLVVIVSFKVLDTPNAPLLTRSWSN